MRSALALAAVLLAACGDPSPDPPEAAASGVLSEMQLLDRFPDTAAGFPRVAATTETDGALGYEVARASANYTATGDRPGPFVGLNLLDLGSADMAQSMGFGWGLAGTPDTTIAGFPARAQVQYQRRVVQVLVGERFLVEALGEGVPPSEVEAAVLALDLPGLARLAGS